MTGTGGGIFLTRWFCFVNGLGLVGPPRFQRYLSSWIPSLVSLASSAEEDAWPLLLAAILGGTAGSYFGSRRFPVRVISLLLATVLIIAGLKLLLTH